MKPAHQQRDQGKMEAARPGEESVGKELRGAGQDGGGSPWREVGRQGTQRSRPWGGDRTGLSEGPVGRRQGEAGGSESANHSPPCSGIRA